VTGSPYSAHAVTETTQVLADGNRIVRRTTTSTARDSKGRVRREQQGLALGGVMIEGPMVTIADPVARTHVTLDDDRRVAFVVSTPRFAGGDGRAGAADPRPAPRSVVEPSRNAGIGDIRTETLGEREIEGVRAEGTRTTMTIPAQAIGNEAPITTVSERWFSRELQVVVFTRRSDPRFGETVYRLSNIVRAEPPAGLFAIPGDYRVEEQSLQRPARTGR
jgi:hypothetical protein